VEHSVQRTMSLLSRTPAALDALLRGLPEEWTRASEGEGTWSVGDVIAHLIHAERADWVPRASAILKIGEAQAFEPAFEPFDRWGNIAESRDTPVGQLLDEFARLRAENLDLVRGWDLAPEDLARRGRHPGLGVVTLSQLLATWAVHDLTHLHQISRVMAYQYRDAVGPWKGHLGVLQCAGHSAP
jgi:DinB superfamily